MLAHKRNIIKGITIKITLISKNWSRNENKTKRNEIRNGYNGWRNAQNLKSK
jgi:hypothetical protein